MHDYRGINRISTLEREAKSARTLNSSRKSQDSDESPKVIYIVVETLVRPAGEIVLLSLTKIHCLLRLLVLCSKNAIPMNEK